MSGMEIHNLQISLAQAPAAQKAVEAQVNGLANQAQFQAALSQASQVKKPSVVHDLDASDATEPEEDHKEQIKKRAKDSRPHIDIKI